MWVEKFMWFWIRMICITKRVSPSIASFRFDPSAKYPVSMGYGGCSCTRYDKCLYSFLDMPIFIEFIVSVADFQWSNRNRFRAIRPLERRKKVHFLFKTHHFYGLIFIMNGLMLWFIWQVYGCRLPLQKLYWRFWWPYSERFSHLQSK